MLDFFNNVLPSAGMYAGVLFLPGEAQPRTFFTYDYHHLDSKLTCAANTPGVNAYFATSALYPGAATRKSEHVFAGKCIHHDIDIDPAKGGYATLADAWLALFKAVDDDKLVRPSHVVLSGGGMHVYWCFNLWVDGNTKKRLGERLTTMLKAADPKLCIDMSSTAKAITLLRWPGTLNWKRGTPRPVDVIYDGPTYTIEALDARLPAAPVLREPNTPIIALNGSTTCPGTFIHERCYALRHWHHEKQTKETGTYDAWAQIMHLAGWTDNPTHWAHVWSAGPYEDLPRAVTMAQEAAVKRAAGTAGPTSCRSLTTALGLDFLDTCKRCPLAARGDGSGVSSPAKLHETVPVRSPVPTIKGKQRRHIGPRTYAAHTAYEETYLERGTNVSAPKEIRREGFDDIE